MRVEMHPSGEMHVAVMLRNRPVNRECSPQKFPSVTTMIYDIMPSSGDVDLALVDNVQHIMRGIQRWLSMQKRIQLVKTVTITHQQRRMGSINGHCRSLWGVERLWRVVVLVLGMNIRIERNAEEWGLISCLHGMTWENFDVH